MASRETFDVVVVGGAAAGCVVAVRLAESASRSVLLVDATQIFGRTRRAVGVRLRIRRLPLAGGSGS